MDGFRGTKAKNVCLIVCLIVCYLLAILKNIKIKENTVLKQLKPGNGRF